MTKILESAWIGILAIATDMVMPFIMPVSGYLIFMIGAICADTITGILAAMKERHRITSDGIWRTLTKIVIAGIAIMLSYGFEILFVPDLPLTKGVSAIIAFAEFKSNLENYARITGVEVGAAWLDALRERIFPVPPTKSEDIQATSKYDQYDETQ